MNVKALIGSGYFPKELPPPFETLDFSKQHQYVTKKWNLILSNNQKQRPGESTTKARKRFKEEFVPIYSNSKQINYSLAKGIYSRRILGIPNPKQYLELANVITENWRLLKSVWQLSEYSQSMPCESNSIRSVRTKSNSWNEFKFDIISKSFNRRIELKLDISKFYPSIYTHSIPWAILGKVESKKQFNLKRSDLKKWESLVKTNLNSKNYKISDQIDTSVRNCNEMQSVGLPIGPDISFVLAEVIGGRIDYEIKSKLNNIDHSGVRYFDDYYFYFDTFDDAEKALKLIQGVFYDFQLETNESKVIINELPFEFTEIWAKPLTYFVFKRIDKYELRDYFSILFELVSSNKKNSSWIINYGLTRFEQGNVKISEGDWNIFLIFLLKIITMDASNIDKVFRIIYSYKQYLNSKSRREITHVIEKSINEHLALNHSFEVSWGLWILLSFKIKVNSSILESILNSNDQISKIICLDIINRNMFSGKKPSLKILSTSFKGNNLNSDDWLLGYESCLKGWLKFGSKNPIDNNLFMKILFDRKISFYNSDNQIETYFQLEKEISFKTKIGSYKPRYKIVKNKSVSKKSNIYDFIESDIDNSSKSLQQKKIPFNGGRY